MATIGQRKAICMAFGWDYSDLTEYQATRRMHSRTHLYQVNAGYVLAVKGGAADIPKVYRDEWNWKLVGAYQAWSIFESQEKPNA